MKRFTPGFGASIRSQRQAGQATNKLGAAVVAITAAAIAIGLTTGCGSDSQSPATAGGTPSATSSTASKRPALVNTTGEKLPPLALALKTPAAPIISTHYTCAGADVSPKFTWTESPEGTKELQLFLLSTNPNSLHESAAWAIAGISPGATSIDEGKAPAGTVIGRNLDGQNKYTVCPPRRLKTYYTALLFALPHKVAVRPGFNAEKLANAASQAAIAEGRVELIYERH